MSLIMEKTNRELRLLRKAIDPLKNSNTMVKSTLHATGALSLFYRDP